MIKTMLLDLEVDIENEEINVLMKLEINTHVKSLEFALNRELRVDYMKCKDQVINYTEEDHYELNFRAECKKYTLDIPDGEHEVIISYAGKCVAWQNCILEDFITLNFYSAWYPILENQQDINKVVTIKGLEDFYIRNAERKNDIWQHRCNDFECNIIAMKNWNIKSKELYGTKLSVFCNNFDEKADKDLNTIMELFDDALDYLYNLLDTELADKNSFDIVMNHVEKIGGGYCRNGLVVLSELPENLVQLDRILAHETAHSWSKDADPNTWEDWLNETFAETMALLYIDNKYGNETYMEFITSLKQRAEAAPPIKTEDGHRPEGVHDKGSYLMYQLRNKFGVDTLMEITRIYVKYKVKTTEQLLEVIRTNVNDEVADYIEENLVK